MRRILVLLFAAALAAGCSKSTAADAGADAGTPPEDTCNSLADSTTDATCQLTVGTPVTGFIFPSGDHDWYHLSIPTLPPRPLLQVTAGYDAPESPVTLQVDVFLGDEQHSLGEASDSKPRGAPAPVNVVSILSQPGDYYVLLQDDTFDNDDPTKGDADAKHPYTLTATLLSDPDVNEPNNTPAQATPLTLSGSGQATSTGVLATNGDVDYYAVDIPASDAPPNRTILYVGIDAPDVGVPPAPERIAYTITLDGPDGGTPIAGGESDSPIGEQKTGTARLIQQGGHYLIAVQGYVQHPDTDPPAPGDPRLQYTLTVATYPDLDTNEPNDTPATGTAVNLALGTPQTIEGRLGYIPDPDWYTIALPSSGQNTRLRYKVAFDDAAANTKRFPAVGHPDDRQATLTLLEPDTATCESVCPGDQTRIDDGCTRSTPQCIYSYRLQDPDLGGLGNFEGEIAVPAGAAGTYELLVEDQGNDGADDRAYQLTLSWLPETSDELNAYHDTGAAAVTVSPPLGGYSEDPGNSGAAQGAISYGHAFPLNDQASNAPEIPIYTTVTQDQFGNDVYYEIDYDAVSDADMYRINLPSPGPQPSDGGVGDALAWANAWTVQPGASESAGQRAYDLVMTYFFCDPSENPGCDPTGTFEAIPLAYHSGTVAGWVGATTDGFGVDANSGRIVAKAAECFCIEPRFVAGGVMYMQVQGGSRTTYDDANYEVDSAFSTYPAAGCPPVVSTDGGAGGCHFCDQQFGNGCQQTQGLVSPVNQ